MAKNGLKNRIQISNAIKKDIYVRLKSYSDESRVPISKILDDAITMYLDAKTEGKSNE